jgi:hypothetical protein
MKLAAAFLCLLIGSTATAQTFEYLPGITHSLDTNDFDIRTATAWQAFFAPVGITQSGVGGHFAVTEPTEVLLTAIGSGADSSFTITDITKPPQQIVVNFSGGSLEQMLTLSNESIYNLGASAFSKSGSSVGFSLTIVPEPSGLVLCLAAAVSIGILNRKRSAAREPADFSKASNIKPSTDRRSWRKWAKVFNDDRSRKFSFASDA